MPIDRAQAFAESAAAHDARPAPPAGFVGFNSIAGGTRPRTNDGPPDTEGCVHELLPELPDGVVVDQHNGLAWEYEPVTAEAQRIVFGARGDDYGHPAEDFKRLAEMVSGYLGVHVNENDMAMILVLLKVSRQKNKVKRDNCTDICGYALCADRIREYQRESEVLEFARAGHDCCEAHD